MKKCTILVFLLSFLCIHKIHAQNTFAPLGAEWWYDADSYDYVSIISPGITQQYYWTDHAKITGDTIINGTTCRKIEISRMQNQSSKPDSTYLAKEDNYYVYDNTDTVFIYSKYAAAFRPLYIFNLQEHDTICMQNPYPQSSYDDINFCFVVDSIRTQVINTVGLKTIYTTPINTNATDHIYINWGSIGKDINKNIGAYSQRIGINIGLANGILPVYVNPLADGAAAISFPFGKLRCYNDSTLSIHNGNLPCDTILRVPTLAIKDLQKLNSGIALYPNPAKEQLNISFKYALDRDLEVNITDIVGHQLQSLIITRKTSSTNIDVSKYPSGIYLMTFQDGAERFFYKLMVQR